ncbi:MAG: hypothetical protein EPO23_03190 [Xanthobacteraceae bacterium]|nr:MAG: hypothetical protein EPO23_03190 [Xanthobacteraceae bacterium]
MIEAALSWLAGKGLALLLGSLVQFVRDALADARAAQAQRDAGRAEAVNEADRKAADQVAEARDAEADAAKAHADHPTDDGAFDPEFKRKD